MSKADANLSPEDLLATPRLFRRAARVADLDRELAAYRELSSLMTVDPELAIQRFLDLAVELCPAADSAGLSELSQDDEGQAIFRWTAMSGAFAGYVGGTTPRDFSPCGLCLDSHHTILVERPARVFTYFNEAEPEIVEGLIVPLYDTGKRAIGTLWVASHGRRRFDATDARVMEQLAVQLVLAIKLRRKAKVLIELEQVVRDKNVLVQEVNHRVKNTIQMTSALLHLQERSAGSPEARAALKEAQTRLLVLANVYQALLTPAGEAEIGKIDVGALIETLAAALRETAPASSGIRIRTACDRLVLDAGEAVPIGLIVNEAVTNALKHGFAGRRGGEVSVELRTSGRSCALTIQDDGRGFAAPLRAGSLGMRLMQSLARQLKAEFEIDGSAGTRLTLAWRRPAERRGQPAEPVASTA